MQFAAHPQVTDNSVIHFLIDFKLAAIDDITCQNEHHRQNDHHKLDGELAARRDTLRRSLADLNTRPDQHQTGDAHGNSAADFIDKRLHREGNALTALTVFPLAVLDGVL